MSDAQPRPVTRTVTTEWVAVTGPPIPCACGHVHYPRVPHARYNIAPQWHICEDADCGCTGLRRVEDQP